MDFPMTCLHLHSFKVAELLESFLFFLDSGTHKFYQSLFFLVEKVWTGWLFCIPKQHEAIWCHQNPKCGTGSCWERLSNWGPGLGRNLAAVLVCDWPKNLQQFRGDTEVKLSNISGLFFLVWGGVWRLNFSTFIHQQDIILQYMGWMG